MNHKLFGFVRTLHAWGGVTLALLLMLSGLTGSILVWKQDLVRLAEPAAQVEFDPTPAALARIAAAAEARYDNNEILGIQFATADFPLTKVLLADTRYAYLDPEGGLVDEWVQNERWEEWLYDLHHRLLLEDLGLTLVGLAAIALIILVLAGVITFWPLRRGFRQGLWPKGAARGQLLASHRNLGIILALPLLLTLVTAVLLAFPQRAEEILLEEVRGTQEYSDAMVVGIDDISGGDSGDWLPAMRRALAVFAGGQIRSATVPNAFSLHRIIGIQQRGEWNPNGLSRVYIDAELGYMDLRIDAQGLPAVERAYNAGYPLHTGKTGSLLYKILLTASGLLAATLSGIGLYCFLRNHTTFAGRRVIS